MNQSIRTVVEESLEEWGILNSESRSLADTVLEALEEAGLRVVPVEPTDEIAWAGCEHEKSCDKCLAKEETPYGPGTRACRLTACKAWRAMLEAAR